MQRIGYASQRDLRSKMGEKQAPPRWDTVDVAGAWGGVTLRKLKLWGAFQWKLESRRRAAAESRLSRQRWRQEVSYLDLPILYLPASPSACHWPNLVQKPTDTAGKQRKQRRR
jgi:hypothetical protein